MEIDIVIQLDWDFKGETTECHYASVTAIFHNDNLAPGSNLR